MTFDVVAGCGVEITIYKEGGSSRDRVGIAPFAYGLRMPDNKAVVMKTPEVCAGETTDAGTAAPDFIPFFAVFESADKPMYGLGYPTEDAST